MKNRDCEPSCDKVDRSHEDAARVDAGANLREEIALQIVEIADQLVGVRRDEELVLFEVGEARVDGESGGLRAQQTDGDGGGIDCGDMPAETGEVEGMASGAAGEVERDGREASMSAA